MRNEEWIVGEDEAGARLDKFLASGGRLQSRGNAAQALERGKIFVNGEAAGLGDAATRLARGDVVRLWADRPGSRKGPRRVGSSPDLDVVFEDDVLLVVNKPAGVLSVPLERHPGVPSVYAQIEMRLRPHGKRRPFTVHRIDQDTSGLIVFAKDADTQRALMRQFARREPERVYWAVVYGHPSPPRGTWRDTIVWDDKALVQKAAQAGDRGALEAELAYRTLETFTGAALLEIHLHTGRRNQIRIQARLRSHSLVGEQRYRPDPAGPPLIAFGRQALHACRLGFVHPADGRGLRFEAPPPGDFAELLGRLRSKPRRRVLSN